jgi:hypothetical protein
MGGSNDGDGGYARRPGGSSHGGGASSRGESSGVPGKRTLTESLAPVQRKPATQAASVAGDRAAEADHEEAPPEKTTEDFAPAIGTKTTTLVGTYGEYEAVHGLTKLPDPTKRGAARYGEYSIKITMTPKAAAGSNSISFIQSIRIGTSAAFSTKATDPDIGAEKAARADPKTGWFVDRATVADKTPWYGMTRTSTGLTEGGNVHAGKVGGDKPWLSDKPGIAASDRTETISTATDMTTGAQLDAVGWGYNYDLASKTWKEETPWLVKAGDLRMAGRDRSNKLWNDKVATTGSGIDKVPMPNDPAGTADILIGAMTGAIDHEKVISTLTAVTDAAVRSRVAACYELETGRKLKDDLTKSLGAAEQKKVPEWLT